MRVRSQPPPRSISAHSSIMSPVIPVTPQPQYGHAVVLYWCYNPVFCVCRSLASHVMRLDEMPRTQVRRLCRTRRPRILLSYVHRSDLQTLPNTSLFQHMHRRVSRPGATTTRKFHSLACFPRTLQNGTDAHGCQMTDETSYDRQTCAQLTLRVDSWSQPATSHRGPPATEVGITFSRRPKMCTVRETPHRPTDFFGPRVREVRDRPTDPLRPGAPATPTPRKSKKFFSHQFIL